MSPKLPYIITAFAAVLGLSFLADDAAAQSSNAECFLVQKDWTVCTATNPKECYITSLPKKSVITDNGRVVQARRGEARLYAVIRPSQKVVGQPTFTGGYPFNERTGVSMDIDGTIYRLPAKGEWAWPEASSESNVIASLKKGRTAVMTGRSTRGKIVKDSFSLSGFTAAFEEARKLCK